MRKIVRLGTAATPNGRRYSIFCEVKLNASRLVVTGVEGPLRDGSALGEAGPGLHIILRSRKIRPARGWDHAMLSRFLDAWALYGSTYAVVPLPVREFLEALPDADVPPAWV